MGDLKHIVVAKFKEGVIVDELVEGMEKMVLDIQAVEYIEWGHDIESNEMLTQGYTHVFSMTFRNSEDLTAYLGNPSHVAFSTTFTEAIEKIMLFDFPAVIVKASA
ncbi:hypothetical protein MKW94_016574 [Papaver nudicaule]|uniref:Stress-response A/B barrel domain-containing protein n=1 Tax=Papaver nudicaule TaxID=74823 RepID=A0AA42B285_PAPNU|nr:hypothetical protein [Papaver nudicaule]MCL7048449.1 hypothetical protein [Papaver nudicaule]